MSTTKQRAITEVVWSLLQRLGAMAITFASNVILVCLLTQDDYGCIGMTREHGDKNNQFLWSGTIE